jgi:hypothetical protein
MLNWIRDVTTRLRAWWDEHGSQNRRTPEEENRFLTFFRPEETSELPKTVQRAMAVGTLAAILALGGFALVSLSGLLISLFAIYFLATEILGLELEIDPRILQAM